MTGRVVHQDALRVNPSGVRSLECTVLHESEVVEAGHPRKLAFSAAARALGPVAEALRSIGPEQPLRLSGFVAPRRGAYRPDPLDAQPAASLIFHITEFELE